MKNLLCVLVLFVLFACDRTHHEEMIAEVPDAEVFEETILAKNVLPPPDMIKRKLIQNGSIYFEVANVSATRSQVASLTSEAGGYIASEKNHNNNDKPKYEQVVRIPGDQLAGFVSKIEALASKIENKDFSAQDVTEEFVDLEGRLVVQKELEARYREIVKQARTVKDILQVEEQIGIVRTEIESIQGRLKYLSNKVSYSTITLTYYQPEAVVTPGIGSKFADSFFGGWDALVAFLVALTRTWPFMIIIGGFVWLMMRRRRKEPKQLIQS